MSATTKTVTTEESDEELQLPEDTLKILNEFLAEKKEKEENELSSKSVTFEENWQLSQFWYNEKTKSDLTKICQQIITDQSNNIALLSCPSLYSSVKKIHDEVKIFEYDKRFASYGDDFVHYDFNEAQNPNYLENYNRKFDIIIADPPFLSEECIEKISIIIKRLMKNNDINDSTTKIMFCSGSIVEQWITKYLNLQKTIYKPEHERNLGNDFVLYTNFDINLNESQ